MESPIIELRHVTKSFGPVDVLKGVNFTAHAGRVTALVGDNGAGKSTLIKGLAGVQPYDGGEVLFDGEAVHIHHPREALEWAWPMAYESEGGRVVVEQHERILRSDRAIMPPERFTERYIAGMPDDPDWRP